MARNAKRERARWQQWAEREGSRVAGGRSAGRPRDLGGLEYLADEAPRGPHPSARGSGIWDHQSASTYEEELARALRRARVSGFERNAHLGPWELDFLWRRERLVVEVDGFTHLSNHQRELDRHKEETLRERGYCLLRFQNQEVRAHPEACVRRIQKALRGS